MFRGTVGAVGWIAITSVVGAERAGTSRVAVPTTTPSTSTSYSVPARNGKRGTKQASSPSTRRRPAVAGRDCTSLADTGRTATSSADAPPPTRRHGAPSHVDHESPVTTTAAASERCGLQRAEVLAAAVVDLQRKDVGAVEVLEL